MEQKLKCRGKCRRVLPLSSFSSHKSNHWNMHKEVWCKSCHREYNRLYWKNYKKRRNEMRSGKSTRLDPARPTLPATA